MSAGRRLFIDTNVLIYAIDADEPAKREIAAALLSEHAHSLVLSAQVLGEYYSAATRKLGARPADARRAIETLALLPTVAIDASLVASAVAIATGSQLSYWDAQIVAAAATASCECVLTEDLNDGQVIAGVRIRNPFAGDEP